MFLLIYILLLIILRLIFNLNEVEALIYKTNKPY